MKTLLYRPHDIAWIICSQDMQARESQQFIKDVWEYERAYIHPQYLKDLRVFSLDVMNQVNYYCNFDEYNSEFPQINKHLFEIGSSTVLTENEYSNSFDLFFKNMRLKIMLGKNQTFVRMKLRTLLKAYGYQKRTKRMTEYIKNCLYFYHIETYTKGEKCDLEYVMLDDMITFRIVGIS